MRTFRRSDFLFYLIVYLIVIFAFIVTLYPFIYVFSVSLSSEMAINKKMVYLFPVDLDLSSYKVIFNSSAIWLSYYNTIWYTIIGTLFNLVFTCIAAYPLARKKFFARKFFNFFFTFTMFFSGGLIPFYILVIKIGLYNSRWAMVLPGLIAIWNLMICRTSFEAIPSELNDSAAIEGCSDIRILVNIAIPLSKSTLAVLVLYYAVGHWNNFFGPLLFLADTKLHPIQMLLRRIIYSASPELLATMAINNDLRYSISTLQLKFASIIIAIWPILLVYPFIQKYLVKGVMIGAVKG